MSRVLVIMPTRTVPDRIAWRAADAAARRVNAIIEWPQIEPREKARNLSVNRFLTHPEKPSHLCFIDDDNVVPEDAIELLLEMAKPIACGCCPIMLEGRMVVSVSPHWDEAADGAWWLSWWLWKAGVFMDADKVKFWHRGQPQRVAVTGFPIVLIAREVLERLTFPWFLEDYGDQTGLNGHTEDVWFSRQAVAAGYEIWCHPAVECGHRKTVDLRDFAPMNDLELVKLLKGKTDALPEV